MSGAVHHRPPWLKIRLRTDETFRGVRSMMGELDLNTVCVEARCPNIYECWSAGTATFMIAGKECTRGCRFCSVETLKAPPPLDPTEPDNLADAVLRMRLSHVVITVVNRDDMPDGGAMHYRQCVERVRQRVEGVTIELLSSDLAGNWRALESLLVGLPLDVFAHNVECVPRLDKRVRDPRASFELSRPKARQDVELRAFLRRGSDTVSETWSYLWQPTP